MARNLIKREQIDWYDRPVVHEHDKSMKIVDNCQLLSRRFTRALIAQLPKACGLVNVNADMDAGPNLNHLTLTIRIVVPHDYEPDVLEEMGDAIR